VSSVAHRGLVHVGMDVSKDAVVVAVLPPDRDVAGGGQDLQRRGIGPTSHQTVGSPERPVGLL
jgi:hypothetical protein